MNQNAAPMNSGRPVSSKSKISGGIIALIVGASLVFLGIIVVVIIIAVSVFSAASSSGPSYTGTGGYIAVLHIEGTITSAAPASSLFIVPSI